MNDGGPPNTRDPFAITIHNARVLERRTPILELTKEQIAEAVQKILPGAQILQFNLPASGRANTNYVLETTHGALVLRIYTRRASLCAKERALQGLLQPILPLARIFGSGAVTLVARPPGERFDPAVRTPVLKMPISPPSDEAQVTHPFSLFEFVRGDILEQVALCGDARRLAAAGSSLGRALAKLTEVKLPSFGDLVVDETSGKLSVQSFGFPDFYQWCLFESPAAVRLGSLRDRLWAFLQTAQVRYADTLPIHLVHGDFNPSNLLIGADGEVAAILDWEFAHAGRLWTDIGNLLRSREEVLPPEFDEAFGHGLAQGGVALPEDWRERAEFHDLSSACEFLSSEEERPAVHARARRQIEQTLSRLER